MPNELDLQKDIVSSTRIQHGFGLKLSHQFAIGIPDLLLHVPGFVPVLAEVKLLRKVGHNFKRMVNTTKKQKSNLNRFQSPTVGIRCSILLIGFQHPEHGHILLATTDHQMERLEVMGDTIRTDHKVINREVGKVYNMSHLFKIAGVSRIRSLHGDL